MRKILEQCPNCGGDFEITRIQCKSCDTVILSQYEPCRFCKLSPESLRFLEAFVRARGNVKEMERELGISYWSIRSKLDDMIQELGYKVEADADVDSIERQRREILEQVKRKELSAAEAAQRLSALSRPDSELESRR